MTIAAGFNCRDGLLVCADTELSFMTTKGPGPKWAVIQRPRLKAVLVGAGDMGFLAWTFQECQAKLRDGLTADHAYVLVGNVVREAHKEHIYPAKNAGYDSGIDMIGALWSPGRSILSATDRTATRRVDPCDWATIGAGYEVGQLAVDWLGGVPFGDLRLLDAVVLGVGLLRSAKDHARYCGGASHVFCVTPDGRVEWIEQALIGQVEAFLKAKLDGFRDSLRQRENWPAFQDLTRLFRSRARATPPDLRSPKRGRKGPPASQA